MDIDKHQCHLIFTNAVPDRFVGCSTLPAIYSMVGNLRFSVKTVVELMECLRNEPFHASLGLLNSIKMRFHLNFVKNLEDSTACPMA